ncbi:clamp loader of DNA polymerase [Acidovorax phage ACP17]|uniref:DNA polymerase clamp loader subunit n=1 Tax=Acidovorax phage ACP17 TaxID=2010329 RepID=A0A218M2X0_9CAUD|nr:clamp loader of DNA polymerase [Acidovorax phage ACP17]ASD50391.1 DNA polymerase clamp loader subunit [Acidovorax phage ACP17]
MSEKLSPFDIAKNINSHGPRLDTDEAGFESFVIVKIMSNTPDSVFFANELNQYWQLDKQLQYDFLRFGLPKNMRRFGKWEKKSKDDEEDLAAIMEAFGYSRNKALEVYPVVRGKMDEIKAHLNKGGRK